MSYKIFAVWVVIAGIVTARVVLHDRIASPAARDQQANQHELSATVR